MLYSHGLSSKGGSPLKIPLPIDFCLNFEMLQYNKACSPQVLGCGVNVHTGGDVCFASVSYGQHVDNICWIHFPRVHQLPNNFRCASNLHYDCCAAFSAVARASPHEPARKRREEVGEYTAGGRREHSPPQGDVRQGQRAALCLLPQDNWGPEVLKSRPNINWGTPGGGGELQVPQSI